MTFDVRSCQNVHEFLHDEFDCGADSEMEEYDGDYTGMDLYTKEELCEHIDRLVYTKSRQSRSS